MQHSAMFNAKINAVAKPKLCGSIKCLVFLFLIIKFATMKANIYFSSSF